MGSGPTLTDLITGGPRSGVYTLGIYTLGVYTPGLHSGELPFSGERHFGGPGISGNRFWIWSHTLGGHTLGLQSFGDFGSGPTLNYSITGALLFGGLHSERLHLGGRDSRATDLGSGPALTHPMTGGPLFGRSAL